MWWRSLLSKEPSAEPTVKEINRLREHYARMPDGQVDQARARRRSCPRSLRCDRGHRGARARPADVRRADRRRARAGRRKDRRNADGRRQDAGGGARDRVAGPRATGRARAHGQRLPRAARCRLDARRSTSAWDCPSRRSMQAMDAGRAAGGLRARHHLRDGERSRFRLPARRPRDGSRPSGSTVRSRRRSSTKPTRS